MMDLKGRTLGVLLAAGPGEPGFAQGVAMARAGLERGVTVHVFCVDEAVRGLGDVGLQGLRAAGVRLHACALSARRRGLEPGGLASPAGLALASAMIAKLDRVLAFS